MKIKPTEMQASGEGGQIKPKVLPLELIRRHSTIAFVGIMHDNLGKGFSKILDADPSHRWAGIYIFFPSDRCLEESLSQNYSKPVKELIVGKHECREKLHQILKPVVDDLRFLQYNELKHCGSYWDWRDPGKKSAESVRIATIQTVNQLTHGSYRGVYTHLPRYLGRKPENLSG